MKMRAFIIGAALAVAAGMAIPSAQQAPATPTTVDGLVSAANRDPDHYERGEEFVIDRQRNHHMGFANGPHRCLGAHLARREMQVALEEWLRVIPDFRIATDAEEFSRLF